MEGTHCTLQLRKPVTELCYISFYLPRGEVRGFSYKGAVTLDKSNKGFHSCYQVRVGSDIISFRRRPNQHPGDIFFKQTPTKDILTELYKLTAERERLLADLLSSDHILGITMGNQEGKLPELLVSLAPEDDCFQGAGDWQGEPHVGSLNKRSTHGHKKPRRFGGRRKSFQTPLQKRVRSRGQGGQESAAQTGKDRIYSSNSFPPPQARRSLLEEGGSLFPNGALTTSLQRSKSCPPKIPGTLDAEPGFGVASEDTGLGGGAWSPDHSSTEAGDNGVEGPQRGPHSLGHRQISLSEDHQDPEKQPETEKGWREKSAEQTCGKKPVSKVVAKVQNVSAQVQRVVQTREEGKKRIAVCPEARAEFIPKADLLSLPGAEAGAQCSRLWGREQPEDPSSARLRVSTCQASASAEGAVNKVLLKVIESEKLNEASEGKRLGFPFGAKATHALPETRCKRKTGLPLSGHKTLFLNLPQSAGPDSSQPRGDEKRLSPAARAALGVVFNNSCPQSGTRRLMPPLSSPLSPRLPSPQQHHRILRLPSLPGETEAALSDCPPRKRGAVSASPSADTLEPPSSAKVTETKGASSASLRAGQPRLVPGEPLEKSLGPGKTTGRLQHQSPPARPEPHRAGRQDSWPTPGCLATPKDKRPRRKSGIEVH
ncbi:formin-1 isoform 4-T5 [Dugong dugon]